MSGVRWREKELQEGESAKLRVANGRKSDDSQFFFHVRELGCIRVAQGKVSVAEEAGGWELGCIRILHVSLCSRTLGHVA